MDNVVSHKKLSSSFLFHNNGLGLMEEAYTIIPVRDEGILTITIKLEV